MRAEARRTAIRTAKALERMVRTGMEIPWTAVPAVEAVMKMQEMPIRIAQERTAAQAAAPAAIPQRTEEAPQAAIPQPMKEAAQQPTALPSRAFAGHVRIQKPIGIDSFPQKRFRQFVKRARSERIVLFLRDAVVAVEPHYPSDNDGHHIRL